MQEALGSFLEARLNNVFEEVTERKKEIREIEAELDDMTLNGEIPEEIFNKIINLTAACIEEGYKIGLRDGLHLPNRFKEVLGKRE